MSIFAVIGRKDRVSGKFVLLYGWSYGRDWFMEDFKRSKGR